MKKFRHVVAGVFLLLAFESLLPDSSLAAQAEEIWRIVDGCAGRERRCPGKAEVDSVVAAGRDRGQPPDLIEEPPSE